MTTSADKYQTVEELLDSALQEDREGGVYRCRRDIFTNPELFELEMKYLFESNWVYLAHESQIPANNDYYTNWMGRQPVIVTRDKNGELHGLINACAHKGAMLCRRKHGNKGSFTCPFHGWTFANSGKLLKVKDEKTTQYPASFNQNGSHDLTRMARFQNYRGFLFGSLSDDVLPLEEYLGETRVIIDQIVDQAPEGLEVLRGNSSYIYDGNWSKAIAGVYGFEHGHTLLWTNTLNPEVRPIWNQREALAQRVGQNRADIIVSQTRNLCIYPNVFLMDQFGTQIRVARPLSVNQTEVSIFCFGPKGESAEDRALRIRQYEDFFNVSGMGTADDLEEFRACQTGYAGSTARYNDLSRGAPLWVEGPDENAARLGMKPLLSGERSEDEGLFVCQHHYWTQEMKKAVRQERQGVQA